MNDSIWLYMSQVYICKSFLRSVGSWYLNIQWLGDISESDHHTVCYSHFCTAYLINAMFSALISYLFKLLVSLTGLWLKLRFANFHTVDFTGKCLGLYLGPTADMGHGRQGVLVLEYWASTPPIRLIPNSCEGWEKICQKCAVVQAKQECPTWQNWL